MKSEGKPKGQAARKDTGRRTLARLKPEEAAGVLRHLLEVHPELASEAEGMARSLLHQVEYEDIAAEIEDEIRALDYEVLNARAGGHEGGYVLGWPPDFPGETASHALEVWYTGSDAPKSRAARRKKLPPLPPDFLNLVPKWIRSE